MEFRLLGPLEVLSGGRSVLVGGGKRRSLLGVLLVHSNEVVSAERLIDELWGERPPPTAAKSVQVYVSQLRKQLAPDVECANGGRLVTRSGGYELRVGPDELDVAVFERALAEGERALGGGEGARGGGGRGGGGGGRAGAGGEWAASRVGVVARAGAGGLRLRAVRAGRDRP